MKFLQLLFAVSTILLTTQCGTQKNVTTTPTTEKKVETVKEEVKEAKTAVKDAKEEIKEVKAETKEAVKEAKEEMKEVATEKKEAKFEKKDAKLDKMEAKEEMKEAKKEMKEAREEIEEAKMEMEKAEGKGEKAMEEAKEEMKEAIEEAKEAQAEMNEAKEELIEAREEKKEAKADIKEAKEEMKEVKEEMKEAKDEVKEAKEEVGEAKEELKDAKEEMKAVVAESKMTAKDKTVALLESLESGDKKPVSYINPNKYIQHNLSVGDGLAGFGEVMANAPADGFKANVVRAFQDGDYTFTHTVYDFFGPKVGFDVFRYEDGLIVEHWDNLTAVTPENPSGRSQTDGPTKAKDLDKTVTNKALVKDFLQSVLVEGTIDKMATYFDGDKYIQHNSAIGDGLSGLMKAMEDMAKQNIKMEYKKVHQVLGEGNFVLAISEGAFAGKPTAYYDLFRIENGKIAEHWDVIADIPPKSEWKNNNGKF